MAKKPSVVILYNLPRPEAGAPDRFVESDMGVLDEVAGVAEALDALGIKWRKAGVRILQEAPDAIREGDEEVVFNLVEGFHSRPSDMVLVPSVARALGRGVTGSGTPCLALALDKWMAKGVLSVEGLPCPKGVMVPKGRKIAKHEFSTRVAIVKPTHSDASEGIDDASVVRGGGEALAAAVRRVHRECGQAAVVEEYIDGRELNVSVIERKGRPEVLPIAEIHFRGYDDARPRIVGYSAKWLAGSFEYENTERVIPAKLHKRVEEAVRETALGAWKALGCSDYARVDMRLDASENVYVLEVNPNPDITPDVGFPSALAAAGIEYRDFVKAVVENAMRRREADRKAARAAAPRRRGSKKQQGPAPRIRRSRQADRDAIVSLIERTGFFREDEVTVAAEVLDEALEAGPRGHYQSFTAEADGRPAGWACFGPTPCTVGTFDIYWIAVDPDIQGRGIGRALMAHAEGLIRKAGGKLAIIETSGRDLYAPTQQFYLRVGYTEAARIPHFYGPDDAKIIYAKQLG